MNRALAHKLAHAGAAIAHSSCGAWVLCTALEAGLHDVTLHTVEHVAACAGIGGVAAVACIAVAVGLRLERWRHPAEFQVSKSENPKEGS